MTRPAGRHLFLCPTGDILLEDFHFQQHVEQLKAQTNSAARRIGRYRFGKGGLVGAVEHSLQNPSRPLLRTAKPRSN